MPGLVQVSASVRIDLVDETGAVSSEGSGSLQRGALLLDFGRVEIASIRSLGIRITNVSEPSGNPITDFIVGELQGPNPEM